MHDLAPSQPRASKRKAKARPQWGPLYAASPHHPKVWALAERLGCSHHEAYGLICCFWAQSTDRLLDGCLPGKASQLASLAMWTRGAQELGDAFVAVGLIDVSDDGRWYLHDWHEYGGMSAAKVSELVARFGGAAGARESEAKKQARVEVPAAAAAAASDLLSSDPSSSAGAAGGDALQAMDPYEAADALLEREAAEGLTVSAWLTGIFPAFDGRGGRRPLRDVVMLFLDHEEAKYPSKRARSLPVLLARLRRWAEGDYATSLELLEADRRLDDRDRARTGQAAPAPTGNAMVQQTRALLAQTLALQSAPADDDGLEILRQAVGLAGRRAAA